MYAGQTVTPQVTVTPLTGATLTEGTDYTVSYVGNDAVGTALAVRHRHGKLQRNRNRQL